MGEIQKTSERKSFLKKNSDLGFLDTSESAWDPWVKNSKFSPSDEPVKDFLGAPKNRKNYLTPTPSLF